MGLIKYMRNLFFNLFTKHKRLSDIFGTNSTTTLELAAAIKDWNELYCKNNGLQVAALVSSEIARLSTIEFTVDILGISAKSEIFKKIVNNEILSNLRKQLEYGCAYGSLLMKPVFDGKRISIDFVKPNAFVPVSFDTNGNLTSVICCERKVKGKSTYTRVEYCRFSKGVYTVSTEVFQSNTENSDDLGYRVNLSDVPEWASIVPKYTISGISKPLFALFRYPAANNIDIESPMGVSVFSRACDTLRKIDVAYDKFNSEVETSDKVVFAADYLLQKIENKQRVSTNPLPKLIKGLNFTTTGTEIKEWVPDIRDQEYKSVLQMYLDIIAMQCGFDAGYFTFDNSTGGIKTATEVKIDQQRTLTTISDVQIELKKTIVDLLYGIEVLMEALEFVPDTEDFSYSINYKDFNIDPEQERARMLTLIDKGILPKWQYLVKFEGYTEENAKKLIEEASETGV